MRKSNWWDDPKINKLFAVGQAFSGKSIDGQKDGWMLEGIFQTEQAAIKNCVHDDYFVVPVPIGIMTGTDCPDGMWWPRLQSKEEGQVRIEKFRQGLELD